MHIGELLMSGADLLTPWISREADNAIFQYELIQTSNDATINVKVWTKNTEDTGDGTENAGTGSWTDP